MYPQAVFFALGLCASLVLSFDPMEGKTTIICIIPLNEANFTTSLKAFHENFCVTLI